MATVRGWNRVRAADLFKPTPPHNSGMPYGLETKNKQQTKALFIEKGMYSVAEAMKLLSRVTHNEQQNHQN